MRSNYSRIRTSRFLVLSLISLFMLGACDDDNDIDNTYRKPQPDNPTVSGPITAGGDDECCQFNFFGVEVDLREQGYTPGTPFYSGVSYDESEVGYMEDPRLFSEKQLEQLGIVHPRSKNRAFLDSIQQIRTKLFQLKPDGNFSVLVSSVVPEGGASFIALNLAATITFDKAKTSLLIDGIHFVRSFFIDLLLCFTDYCLFGSFFCTLF